MRSRAHEEHALRVTKVGNRQNADARLSALGPEETLDVERLSFEPSGEAWRGQQPVQPHRELLSIGSRIEAPELHHAHPRNRGVDNLTNQVRELDRLPLCPGMGEEVREQDVLAAANRVRLDVEKRQETRNRS